MPPCNEPLFTEFLAMLRVSVSAESAVATHVQIIPVAIAIAVDRIDCVHLVLRPEKAIAADAKPLVRSPVRFIRTSLLRSTDLEPMFPPSMSRVWYAAKTRSLFSSKIARQIRVPHIDVDFIKVSRLHRRRPPSSPSRPAHQVDTTPPRIVFPPSSMLLSRPPSVRVRTARQVRQPDGIRASLY